MQTYLDLLSGFGKGGSGIRSGTDPVHAMLASAPDRTGSLRLCVASLLSQVDTLHVFLEGFNEIPGFLDHDKIFITRSQDFGSLGECGKYYWTDDLEGYFFICSDRLTYPDNYVQTMITRIESLGRKVVTGAGGFLLDRKFVTFRSSSFRLEESAMLVADTPVEILNDAAVAFHSSTMKVSRHFFYHPFLSAFWFSVIGHEQRVPFLCCSHHQGWLVFNDPADDNPPDTTQEKYRDFLIRSYFIPYAEPPSDPDRFGFDRFFDRVYVMNLDRRPDRWRKIMRTARHFRLRLTRFSAEDGSLEPAKSRWEQYFRSEPVVLPSGIEPLKDYKDKFLKYNHYLARIHFMESKLGRKAIQSPGAWGYALSYIRILKEAIQHDLRRILIFDDDILLHVAFHDEFVRHARQLPEGWKLIMLGAMQHYWEPYITMVGDFFYHGYGSSVASHAVGVDRKMFLPLLFFAEKMDLPIDEGAIFHVQNVYANECFIFLPNLAIQDMTGSDINSSAMKVNEREKWQKLFRWDPGAYFHPSGLKGFRGIQKISSYFGRFFKTMFHLL